MGKTLRKISRVLGLGKSLATKPEDAEQIQTFLRWFESAADAEQDQREHELKCLRMCDPEKQWDDEIRSQRDQEERPCLTEDKISPMVLVICNSLRQNRAAVTINPVDDKGDPDTAEVFQGLIRHITYESSADMAYDTASTSCVRTGRGFYRIVTEYEGDDSFDQVIRVKAIPNHHMVYVDPNAVEADYSDANWFMVVEDMDRDEFKAQYPSANSADMTSGQWMSVGDDLPEWYKDDHVRVVECFYKVPTKTKLVRLTDGSVIKASELPEDVKAKQGEMVADGLYIDGVRDAASHKVEWCRFNAVEILERGDWAGKIIPIVPVLGKELIINNKRRYFGLISGMMDSQSRYNWLLSAQLETINLVPRSPWIAPEGSLVNPHVWANSHRRAVGALYYKQTIDGQPINKPERAYSGADVAAINSALMLASEGLKGTSGLYNPSVGSSEGGQSGVAIRAQQSQGDMATYHFTDAVTRARRLEGRIMLELIPKIYDTQRVLRIVNEDETAKTVTVNSEEVPMGQDKAHDLTVGKYDLTVTSGPSYTTRRQENLAVLMNMVERLPLMQQVAPDLIVSQLDVPIAKPLAKRLKVTLPPQVQAEDDQGRQQQVPPQIMQRLQQDGQMISQLTQALKIAQDEHEAKVMELQTKIEIAKIQADATVRAAFIRSESTQMGADGRALLDHTRAMAEMQIPALNAGAAGMGEQEETVGPEAGMEETNE